MTVEQLLQELVKLCQEGKKDYLVEDHNFDNISQLDIDDEVETVTLA